MNLPVLLMAAQLVGGGAVGVPPADDAPGEADPQAQAHAPLFYHGRAWGSEGVFNPLTHIVNSGFGILQIHHTSRKLSDIAYLDALESVVWNLAHPTRGFRELWDTKDYLYREVLPVGFSHSDLQWLPNYALHVLGGGFTSAAMEEWFRTRGAAHPTALAIATVFGAHFVNEVVEVGVVDGALGPNASVVLDLYFFDVAGVLLFRSERVRRFFSGTLRMADWSTQPVLLPGDGTLQNAGQYFALRWRPMARLPASLFVRLGVDTLLGLSFEGRGGRGFSLGVGGKSEELLVLSTQGELRTTVTYSWAAGLFYDRDNSLLASLLVSGLDEAMATANVYPGPLRLGPIQPGLWAAVTRDGGVRVGITSRQLLGLGVGIQAR